MKSASASWPPTSEPASSTALAVISAHDSQEGSNIQPSRILLCGDQVAADGCLSEVSFASAVQAASGAVERARPRVVREAA